MKLAVGLMEGVESVEVELLGTFTDAAGQSYLARALPSRIRDHIDPRCSRRRPSRSRTSSSVSVSIGRGRKVRSFAADLRLLKRRAADGHQRRVAGRICHQRHFIRDERVLPTRIVEGPRRRFAQLALLSEASSRERRTRQCLASQRATRSHDGTAGKPTAISTFVPTITASDTRALPRRIRLRLRTRFTRRSAKSCNTKAGFAMPGFRNVVAACTRSIEMHGMIVMSPISFLTGHRREMERVYCDTTDKALLAQILPGFDQETQDFYRWTVRYSGEEIRHLIWTRLRRTWAKLWHWNHWSVVLPEGS